MIKSFWVYIMLILIRTIEILIFCFCFSLCKSNTLRYRFRVKIWKFSGKQLSVTLLRYVELILLRTWRFTNQVVLLRMQCLVSILNLHIIFSFNLPSFQWYFFNTSEDFENELLKHLSFIKDFRFVLCTQVFESKEAG